MGEVIDFFSRKVIKEDTNHAAGNKKNKTGKEDFEKLEARNKANQDRIRKEREQANKNVMKSYRIK